MMTVLLVHQLAGNEVLAGRLVGNALAPRLESQLPRDFTDGRPVVLNFQGVELVTASCFLAAFGWLWEREASPVIANAAPDCRAEMELALRAANLQALFGSLREGALVDVEPFNLEGTDRVTFDMVSGLGRATAGDLHALDRSIKPSAWSNRLAQLYRYRLVRRETAGRQLVYSVPGS